jgi:hypothetical protein
METTLPPKINLYRIQREIKKMDTQFQTPIKQRQTIPRNPMNPQEHSERRNFHGDVTRHGQPKCTRDTQEIPRQ